MPLHTACPHCDRKVTFQDFMEGKTVDNIPIGSDPQGRTCSWSNDDDSITVDFENGKAYRLAGYFGNGADDLAALDGFGNPKGGGTQTVQIRYIKRPTPVMSPAGK